MPEIWSGCANRKHTNGSPSCSRRSISGDDISCNLAYPLYRTVQDCTGLLQGPMRRLSTGADFAVAKAGWRSQCLWPSNTIVSVIAAENTVVSLNSYARQLQLRSCPCFAGPKCSPGVVCLQNGPSRHNLPEHTLSAGPRRPSVGWATWSAEVGRQQICGKESSFGKLSVWGSGWRRWKFSISLDFPIPYPGPNSIKGNWCDLEDADVLHRGTVHAGSFRGVYFGHRFFFRGPYNPGYLKPALRALLHWFTNFFSD